MAVLRCCAIGIGVLALGAAAAGADGVMLRETTRAGALSRVLITLKADGFYQPGPPPGTTAKSEPPKPLALKVATQLRFAERVLEVNSRGRVSRVVRRVSDAASAINGEVRPMGATLRPEVRLLVAELRRGAVVVSSPGGPLTRPELELVQGPGDPLTLAELLPDGPVAVGDHWKIGAEAARSLTSYDAIATNSLEATVDAITDASVKVRLRGQVRGAVLGGEGTMSCDGSFTFDRKSERIDRLTLDRNETRKPGAVEAGLDVKSTLTVERGPAETAAELGERVLAGLSLGADPARERLLLISADGKYTMLHDRDWHLYWDDRRLTVLKRLDQGEVVAQCNLAVGPTVGKGRHQDLGQFREDIRRALGARFGRYLGEGEIDGDPAGGFRYKVGVQGRQGEVGVLWEYYLVASPDGDQLLVTFTLGAEQAKAFGDQDEQLISSLRWIPETEPAPSGKP